MLGGGVVNMVTIGYLTTKMGEGAIGYLTTKLGGGGGGL